MQKTIFIDTCFIVALISDNDQYHQQAIEASESYNKIPKITTDAVILEICNTFSKASRKSGKSYKEETIKIVNKFLKASPKDIEIVHLTPYLFFEAFEKYKKYTDKDWGLVDCLSFVVMEQRHIKKVLTIDEHFRQAGFEMLMNQ